jgi:predicted Zn-dependent protease
MVGRRWAWILTVSSIALLACVGALFLRPDPQLPMTQVLNLIEKGDLATAKTLRNESRKAFSETEEWLLLDGFCNVGAGRHRDALRSFARLSPEGPNSGTILRLTGEALYGDGQLAPALKCFLRVLESSPKDADGHRWLAAIQYDLGNMDAALLHIEEVERLQASDYRLFQLRGKIYLEYGQFPEAARAFSAALEKVEETDRREELILELADALVKQKDFSAALKVLEKAAHSIDREILRAECFASDGQPAEAASVLQAVSGTAPLPLRGTLLLARLKLESGEISEARRLLESQTEGVQSSEEYHHLLAEAFRLDGDADRSQQHLEISSQIKSLKTQLTDLNAKAMDAPSDAKVRRDAALVCEKLGMNEMANIWRKAADECEKIGGK